MSNADLIEQLRDLVQHEPNCRFTMVSPFEAECDCCDAILTNIYNAGKEEAADALELADKRIAELEAELQQRAKQIGVACMKHDLTHSLACGRCLAEAERKLAVAREAMEEAHDASLDEDHRACRLILKTALAQIGGDDEK